MSNAFYFINQIITTVQSVRPQDWFTTIIVSPAIAELIPKIKKLFEKPGIKDSFINHIQYVSDKMQKKYPDAFGGETQYIFGKPEIVQSLLLLLLRSPQYTENQIKNEIERFIDVSTLSPNGR